MATICTTITTMVEIDVLEPMETWAEQQQQACAGKWWNPFCWFVTTLVMVIVWVTRTILQPVVTTVCRIVSWTVFGLLAPFAAAIDAVCQTCHLFNDLKAALVPRTRITFVTSKPSATQPGETDYTFECNCKQSVVEIVVTAASDLQAASKAQELCALKC